MYSIGRYILHCRNRRLSYSFFVWSPRNLERPKLIRCRLLRRQEFQLILKFLVKVVQDILCFHAWIQFDVHVGWPGRFGFLLVAAWLGWDVQVWVEAKSETVYLSNVGFPGFFCEFLSDDSLCILQGLSKLIERRSVGIWLRIS